LLILDGHGVILQVNPAAERFWQSDASDLVGRAFPHLFETEIVSNDPDFLQVQWEAIRATAETRPVELSAQSRQQVNLGQVRVSLEALSAGPAAFLAQIDPRSPEPPAEASPSPPASALQGPPAAFADGFDILCEASSIGFFDLSLNEEATFLSPAWKRLLGHAPDQLDDRYETWRSLLHPDDTAAAPDHVPRRAAPYEQRSYAADFRLRHAAGHWAWFQALGLQLFDQHGKLARVVGVMLDVSERKDLEDQGLLAEERLSRLGASGPVAIFDLDWVSATASLSPSWHAMLGRTTENANLLAVANTFGAPTAESLAVHLSAPAPGEPHFLQPMTLQKADGTMLGALVAGQRQYSRRGDLVRIVGCILPNRLGSSPALLQENALAAINEGVILTDERGRVAYLNAKAARLLQTSLEHSRGRRVAEVFRLVTPEGHRADDAIDLALANQHSPRFNTAHHLVTAEGPGAKPILWTVSEARDRNGQIIGIVVVFRDPHEMSLSPEELVRANRFETLGQLAGGIAHDFNNLLTTILGGISQANENRDLSGLRNAETACMAAKALTRQLLSFAKGSSNQPRQPVNPGDIVRDAVRVATAGAAAQVQVEIEDQMGPVEVDRAQILQVFQNLIINALQAMPEPQQGALWLRCRNVSLRHEQIPPLPAGRYVQIDVQDNGVGIPPENLERIFDPFFTTKKQGTGLGLATVLSIIRNHGGQVNVVSTRGVGTTFSILLPVTDRSVEKVVRRAPLLRQGTGRILVMEDDANIADLTANMLRQLEYTCDVAKNGDEAIALYRRYLNVNRPYDLVLLDLTIVGGMGGVECFSRLREQDPQVRAVASSGEDNDERMNQLLELGFAGYLTKPYRVSDLNQVIKEVLAK
jgi:two-component system, cell cycle sensor histidine kinase and response regulator CckA